MLTYSSYFILRWIYEPCSRMVHRVLLWSFKVTKELSVSFILILSNEYACFEFVNFCSNVFICFFISCCDNISQKVLIVLLIQSVQNGCHVCGSSGLL